MLPELPTTCLHRPAILLGCRAPDARRVRRMVDGPAPQCRKNLIFPPVHARRVRRPPVIIPAQMQAAMNCVERKLASPVTAIATRRHARHRFADHQLRLHVFFLRVIPQIERENVRGRVVRHPASVQRSHHRGIDHRDIQTTAQDSFPLQRLATDAPKLRRHRRSRSADRDRETWCCRAGLRPIDPLAFSRSHAVRTRGPGAASVDLSPAFGYAIRPW